jgi:hypothetical protein
VARAELVQGANVCMCFGRARRGTSAPRPKAKACSGSCNMAAVSGLLFDQQDP